MVVTSLPLDATKTRAAAYATPHSCKRWDLTGASLIGSRRFAESGEPGAVRLPTLILLAAVAFNLP